MKSALICAMLLCAACGVLCYRAPQTVPSGSYTLPKIGNYPSPTVFNPKNHGRPDAYKNFRFSRSVDDQVGSEHENFAEEPAYDAVLRQTRSVEIDGDEFLIHEEPAELPRQRRSPYQYVFPIYRPPRRQKPKIYRV